MLSPSVKAWSVAAVMVPSEYSRAPALQLPLEAHTPMSMRPGPVWPPLDADGGWMSIQPLDTASTLRKPGS
ncbi:hypothetical protein D3C85_329780 [compost metagenome]